MVFSYLVTTGWIFDISLFETSINQSSDKEGSKRLQVITDKKLGLIQKPTLTGRSLLFKSRMEASTDTSDYLCRSRIVRKK